MNSYWAGTPYYKNLELITGHKQLKKTPTYIFQLLFGLGLHQNLRLNTHTILQDDMEVIDEDFTKTNQISRKATVRLSQVVLAPSGAKENWYQWKIAWEEQLLPSSVQVFTTLKKKTTNAVFYMVMLRN